MDSLFLNAAAQNFFEFLGGAIIFKTIFPNLWENRLAWQQSHPEISPDEGLIWAQKS